MLEYSDWLAIGPRDLQKGALKDLLAGKCFVIWDPLDLLRTSLGKLSGDICTDVFRDFRPDVSGDVRPDVSRDVRTDVSRDVRTDLSRVKDLCVFDGFLGGTLRDLSCDLGSVWESC